MPSFDLSNCPCCGGTPVDPVDCSCCTEGEAAGEIDFTLPTLTGLFGDCNAFCASFSGDTITAPSSGECLWTGLFEDLSEPCPGSGDAQFSLSCSGGQVTATAVVRTVTRTSGGGATGTNSKTWIKVIAETPTVTCTGLSVSFDAGDIDSTGTTGVGGRCEIGDECSVQL